MARRRSFRSQLYRAARDVGNLEAAAQGPGAYGKRVVRRRVYRTTNGFTRRATSGVWAVSDRTVTLRSESGGRDKRSLWARIMDSGALDIEGFDSGPSTSIVSGSGSYEWHRTVKAADLPALRERLGIPPEADLLDALEADWSGERSYDLEAVLREGTIPVETFTWS